MKVLNDASDDPDRSSGSYRADASIFTAGISFIVSCSTCILFMHTQTVLEIQMAVGAL